MSSDPESILKRLARTKLARSYLNVGRIIARYWRAYGGWGDLFASVYFHAAVLICASSYGFWTRVPRENIAPWWDLVIAVVPSLLGFTLGGYALLVAFLGEKFRKSISGSSARSDGKTVESPFLVLNATFVHYIVVQTLALVFATLAKTCHGTEEYSLIHVIASFLNVSPIALGKMAVGLWGIGFLLFAYAMTLSAAAAFAVFRIGTWLDKHDNGDVEEKAGSASATTSTPVALPAPTRVGVPVERGEEAEEVAEHEASAGEKDRHGRRRR